MAVVEKEITRMLTEATSTQSIPALMEAFHSIKQLLEEAIVVDDGKGMQAPNDLYLFCCEAAVALAQWPVAQHCAKRLVEGTTTTKAYQIRALLCRAAIDVQATRTLRNRELVIGVQASLVKVVQAMKMALQDTANLSHLVALGSKHLWNIGRSLFKEGTYSDIAGTFGFAVAALEKIEFQDWQVRIAWLLRYATALAGSGKNNEANAVLQKASDVTAKYLPALKLAVFRMQVAMTKLVANPKVKQDAARGVLRAIYASQSVFCGMLEGAAADVELQGAYAELSADLGVVPTAPATPPVADQGAKGASPKLPPPPKKAGGDAPSSSVAEDMGAKEEVFSELGLALALNGDAERASECANVALKSRSLKPRVLGEYTTALVRAIRCGGMGVQAEANSNFLTPRMTAELVAAVREVDRTLESAVRITDMSERNHIVQYGCVLLWNIALPLLQPTLRAQVGRCLQNAAKHLEDIQSNMMLLRTLLYHESAVTDVDSDFLSKASTKVEKALSMDYAADVEEQRMYALLRPLDRFLVWQKRKLDVRGSVYSKPDNPEDEALLVIEQAKDAPLANRLSMLTTASTMLKNSEPPADYFVETNNNAAYAKEGGGKADDAKGKGGKAATGGKKGAKADEEDASPQRTDPVVEAHRNHLRVRSSLWHMILTHAWREKSTIMVDVVRQAANALVARSWVRRGDRDMRQLQADAYFALAEVAVAELEAKGLYVAQRKFVAEDDSSDDEDVEGDETGNADGGSAAETANKSGKGRTTGAPSAGGDEQALLQRIQEQSALVDAAEAIILSNIIEAARIGVDLVQQGFEDTWIVANAATHMWNFHTRAFRDNDYLTSLPGYESLYGMMLAAQMDPKKEAQLMRDTAQAYVLGLLQTYVRDKLAADPSNAKLSPTALAIQATRVNLSTFSKLEPNNAKLLKAWEVCDKMISLLPTAMYAKFFLMSSASVQRLLQKPVDQRPLPQQKLLIVIEQLKQPLGMEEKRTLLNNTGVDLLQQDPNVELCARLAAASLTIPDNDRVTAKVAAVGNQLYADGKLGWKQLDVAQPAGNAKGGAAAASKDKAGGKDSAAAAAAPPDGSKQLVDPAAAGATPSAEDWYWYALLLQYQALAMAQLVNPVLQEKATQWEIRSRSLTSITNSAMAAVQGLEEYRGAVVRKALRIFHNTVGDFSKDKVSRANAYSSLRQILSEKILRCASLTATAPAASALSDMDILADLFVLYLRCLSDNDDFDEGLAALKVAMRFLPASHHKPFWGFDVQFRCSAGLPTNQTLLRVKEYSPETQAQVWVTFANYAKSVEDQRFALQNAVDVLAGKPTEQADMMLQFAQWLLKANYPVTIEVVVDLVMSAVDAVSAVIDTEADEDNISDAASSVGGRSGKMSVADGLASTMSGGGGGGISKSKTVGARSAASTSYTKRRAGAKPSVKALRVALEAYYLLSRVCGREAPISTVGSSVIDARTALAMVVHYAMRILTVSVSAVNSHNQRLKAKALKAQRLAAAGGAVVDAVDPNSIPGDVEVPVHAHGWVGFTWPPSLTQSLTTMRHPSAISASTIVNASSFLLVLEDSAAMLCREGLELQAHPVLQLMRLIIEVVLPPATPQSITALNAVGSTLFDASLRSDCGSVSVVHRISDPYLSNNHLLALAEDARIASESNQGGRSESSSPPAASASDPNAAIEIVDSSEGPPVYKYWAALGRNLLLEGRLNTAQQLLHLALKHAHAYGDARVTANATFDLSRLAFLSGRHGEALSTVQEVLQAHMLDIAAETWVEMKLFELELLLHLRRFEDAMRQAELSANIIQQQLSFCNGLSKDVAARVLPELECLLLVRFATMTVRKLADDADSRKEDLTKLRQQLASLLRRAVDRTAELPNRKANHFQLRVELSKLESEIAYVDPARRLLSKKQRLCREAKWLSRAVQALRSDATVTESPVLAAGTSLTQQLSGILCALGQNLMERVDLNGQLLSAFRGSSFTTLTYPVVEHADAALEGQVVYFMRSSRKQRAADVRKAQRKTLTDAVERQRTQIRRERQAEIDARREQRKAELEAQLKKDPKAKPSAKGAPAVVEEPNVDPLDKCGIPSPPGSDDEGHGEDSQSDEEEELKLALRELPADELESELRITFANAMECFAAAAELTSEGSSANVAARFGLAVALLQSYKMSSLMSESRESLLRGEKPPNTLVSGAVQERWTRVAEAVVEEEVVKGGKKGDTGKKPPPKGTKADTAVSPAPASSAVAAADPKKLAEERCIAVFSSHFVEVMRHAQALHNAEILQQATLWYAECLVLSGQTQAAGLAIETAQAYAMGSYVTELWRASAFPDATEAVLANSMDFIKSHAPHMMRSPHYNDVCKAVGVSSRMLSRVKVQQPLWNQSTAVSEVVPFAADICTLTVVKADGDRWFLSFRKPNGTVDVRYAILPVEQLHEATRAIDELEYSRMDLLANEMPDHAALRKLSNRVRDACRTAFDVLSALWSPVEAAMEAIASKNHLVLCVDPLLLPLPLEHCPSFAKFRSVQRELSVQNVSAKLQRRSVDRYSGASAVLVVDPRREAPGSVPAVLGEEKPRLPQWQLVSAVLDENKQYRYPSVQQIQKALANTAVSSAVVHSCGRFTSIVAVSNLATLSLDHLRVVILMDRGCREVSTRRENQSDMSKTAKQLWAEQPWNVALLLLARGVEFAAINRGPASTSVNEVICRTALGNMDKPQVRSFAEVIAQTIKKFADDDAAGSLPTPSTKPFEITPLYADCVNVCFYGLSPDEPVATKPGGK